MKTILITQRVDIYPSRGERRDALDQRWIPFLRQAGFLGEILPNDREHVCARLKQAYHGVLLTGGNNLAKLDGDAPERDEVEGLLLADALRSKKPVVGVCRGAQFLLNYFGVPLIPVQGHVAEPHVLLSQDPQFKGRTVNSFHNIGARVSQTSFRSLAWTKDEVLEAFTHESKPISGIMWHPEREVPFSEADLRWIRSQLQLED